MKYIKYIVIFLIFISTGTYAQTDLEVGNLHKPSLISTYYFGPNAFPVPDMLDGTVSKDLRAELSLSSYIGFENDLTGDFSVKLNIPLFTDRANLSLWLPLLENYRYSPERRETCRVPDHVISGCETGDLYVSTDIMVLQAERHWLDASVRAALKTATGNGFTTARFYDCPGYFFDATFAKPLHFHDSYIKEFRIAASGGFLCWQTDNGRQNDAVMYGIMFRIRSRHFTLTEVFGGYNGWEKWGTSSSGIYTGDRPMSLKTDFSLHFGPLDILFRHQYGLRDWPFNQFRLGIAYKFATNKSIKK